MANRTYYTAQMLKDEQFMQFPKWLMQDSEFSKLSNDAKVLYCILKDRFKLSNKNHWIDSKGRVFVICKRDSMCKLLNKSKNTVTSIMNELIKNKLVEEEHNGLNRPNYIYLLMPEFSDCNDLEFEEDNYKDDINPQEDNISQWSPKNWESNIPDSVTPNSQRMGNISNNNFSNNNFNNSLNNNIDDISKRKSFVVEEELENHIKNILYNSSIFSKFTEAGDTSTFINAAERVIKIIKKQSKKHRNSICSFNKNQILELLNASLEIENDIYGTFKNPDGYIVSKINEQIYVM